MELLTVIGDDPGSLLPAMLERVETKVRKVSSLLMAIDAEYRTFVMKFVVRIEGQFFGHNGYRVQS
jgi:hypothetical protein